MLEVNGEQITQSIAILFYAGKLANLYPWDPVQAAKVSCVVIPLRLLSGSGPRVHLQL